MKACFHKSNGNGLLRFPICIVILQKWQEFQIMRLVHVILKLKLNSMQPSSNAYPGPGRRVAAV